MYCYLGIDMGTTGVKAVIFDKKGSPLGIGLCEYTLETPSPDIVELDAQVYWDSTKKALNQAADASGIAPEDIRSVAVTGQAETLIMTDRNGVPLRKAIVWLDNRAKEEAAFLEQRFTMESLFRMSGQTEMLPCWPASKILWYQRHEKELFDKTAYFLMVEDFILHKLTGKFGTCRGLMPSSLYYDIRTGEYDKAMLDALGITLEQLPPLHDGTEEVGSTIENDSLVPAGIPAVCAPIDHVCGNLGSGCSGEGMISETTGCTLALCAAFPTLTYDENKLLSTYLGFKRGTTVLLPWAPTAGMLLKHFRDEFTSSMSYKELDAAASVVPPGSEGLILLPHCAGAVSPICNPDARGVAWGVTLAHKKGHFARAIMESVAYLLRSNVEALRNMGASVKEIRSLGGASRSPVWLQIKADVLQLPVTITECEEATALGAAILGAVACSDMPSIEEAVRNMVKVSKRVEPSANSSVYEKSYQTYLKLDELMMKTFGGNV